MRRQVWDAWGQGQSMALIVRLLPTNKISVRTLQSDLAGHWAVKVNGNWQLTLSFEGKDAVLVDYQDYH